MKTVLHEAVNAGLLNSVDKIHGKLCSECQALYSLPALRIDCSCRTANAQIMRAVYSANESELCPRHSRIRLNYFSCLDDLGLSEDALQELTAWKFFEGHPLALELAAWWDGFFFACKAGNRVFALKLIEQVCSLSEAQVTACYSEPSDGYGTVPHDSFQNILEWRQINHIVSLVALQQFETISTLLGKEFYGALPVEVSEFCRWAETVKSDPQFHNLVSRKLVDSGWASELAGVLLPRFDVPRTRFESILFGREDLSIYQSWHTQADLMASQGDQSHIINSLRSVVREFSLLPERAKLALIEAEQRFLDQSVVWDPSATIHGYCKGLEIYLKQRFFEPFRDELLASENVDDLLIEARNYKKSHQFGSLFGLIKNGFIELGGMIKLIELAAGRTSEKVRVLKRLQDFVRKERVALLDREMLERLRVVANSYRNPSAHDSILSKDDLIAGRKEVFSIIESLTGLRLVS